MADVFISYTKPERELSKSLASALQYAGLTVWWDTELLPNDSFRAEIDLQLDACVAAVIIWSDQSKGSYWVLSEADHALRLGKLVNVHHSDIRADQLPKPFGQIHAVPVIDTERIIKAVRHLKNSDAARGSTSPTEAAGMEFITSAINDAIKHAPLLQDLAEQEEWEDDTAYPKMLLDLAEQVYTPLRLFRERLPFPEITSYGGRRLVEHLDEATTYAHRQIGKEVGWLRPHHKKRSVLIGARGDLSAAAENLLKSVDWTTE